MAKWDEYMAVLIRNHKVYPRQKIVSYYRDQNGILAQIQIVNRKNEPGWDETKSKFVSRCFNPNITAENMDVPFVLESETIEGIHPSLTPADIYIMVSEPIANTNLLRRVLRTLEELI